MIYSTVDTISVGYCCLYVTTAVVNCKIAFGCVTITATAVNDSINKCLRSEANFNSFANSISNLLLSS